MNNIVDKFLKIGDKFMPEMHLRQSGFTYLLVDHLLKINKEFKNLCKQEIQIIFTRMNWIKLVFDMMWLMEILQT